jgi:hypothetical protein
VLEWSHCSYSRLFYCTQNLRQMQSCLQKRFFFLIESIPYSMSAKNIFYETGIIITVMWS